jgi:1,4-alpha-glucan branching enzyme
MKPKRAKTHTVKLLHKAPHAEQVCVAGSFNNWDLESHPLKRRRDGVWAITLRIPHTAHQYKFVVDGEWIHDELNPEYLINTYGSINSVFPDN